MKFYILCPPQSKSLSYASAVGDFAYHLGLFLSEMWFDDCSCINYSGIVQHGKTHY